VPRELRDAIRPKITVESHVALEWEAKRRGLDMNAIAREILHDWALNKLEEHRLLSELLQREGLAEVVRPRAGIAKS
jgi:hypothetical protein